MAYTAATRTSPVSPFYHEVVLPFQVWGDGGFRLWGEECDGAFGSRCGMGRLIWWSPVVQGVGGGGRLRKGEGPTATCLTRWSGTAGDGPPWAGGRGAGPPV